MPTVEEIAVEIGECTNVYGDVDLDEVSKILTRFESQVRADQRERDDSLKLLRAANLQREKEWDADGRITDAYRGNELAGEVGEACNVLKKLEREKLGIRGTRATNEKLAEELADVVICVDLIAMQRGIDLGEAIVQKFNATSEKYGLSVFIRQSEPREGKEEA